MRVVWGLGLAALIATMPARADIERKATINCADGQATICLYVLPALPALPGWHRDEDLSFHYRAAVLVPDTAAPTALVGNAEPEDGYKTDHPSANALDGFIADDLDTTRKHNPDATITATDPSPSADGRLLRTYLIRHNSNGHDQIVVYTEDGDKDGRFFCVLMLDTASGQPIKNQLPLLRSLVAKYKHFAP